MFFNLSKDLWSGSRQEGRRSRSYSEVDARPLRQCQCRKQYQCHSWGPEFQKPNQSELLNLIRGAKDRQIKTNKI